MKKYHLNPNDIFLSILGVLLAGGAFIVLIIGSVINGENVNISNIWIVLALLLFTLLLMVPSAYNLNKYGGYMYVDDSRLIFKK